MAGAIVTANVGGATAGQVLVPEPQVPSAVTWPDVVQKSLSDVIDLFRERERSRAAMPPESTAPAPPPAASFAGLASASLFGFPVILLAVILFVVKGGRSIF